MRIIKAGKNRRGSELWLIIGFTGDGATELTPEELQPIDDVSPPQAIFSIPDGTQNANPSGNITITFNEPIRKLDNSPVTNSDITSLVNLQGNGVSVPFVGTINSTKRIITINPVNDLEEGVLYNATINAVVEDNSDNPLSAKSISFRVIEPTGILTADSGITADSGLTANN